jgi:leader peptidase (prepilin peptidase)/N-methyltransferase
LYVLAAIIFLILLTIFVIDLENQVIPDSLVFTGVAVTAFRCLLYNPGTLNTSLLSGLAGATFLLLIHLITRGRGMGLGDVKFAIFGGIVVGVKLLPVWLFLSFLTGAIAGIILILTGKAKLKTKIAFGPFLIIGMALVLVLDKNLSPLINFLYLIR